MREKGRKKLTQHDLQQEVQMKTGQNQNQSLMDFRLTVLIFMLTLILVGSFLRYQQYLQIVNSRQFQPKKYEALESQAAKTLQQMTQQTSKKQEIQKPQNLLLFSHEKTGQKQLQSKEKPSKSLPNIQSNKQSSSFQNEQKTIYNFPILPKLQIPLSQQKVTAVFTTCCSRYDLLSQTLFSFFQQNSFIQGLQQIIVINDGPQTDQIKPVKEKYPNITWLFTPQTVGQIEAIDFAYTQVKTPFVFHAEDDWLFLQPNFIEVSFDYFQRIPQLLQTWIKITNQTVNQQTQIVESEAFGFSFNPGLKKMEHYKMIKNGYKWISKDISHKKGAGKAEALISRYYKKKGFVVAQTELNYVRHIGQNRSLPKASY